MARVYVYERPVDAVLTDVSFYKKLNQAAAGQSIKQEPHDTDNSCQDNTLSLTSTNTKLAVAVKTIVQETQLLDNANNKENELVLSKDRTNIYTSDMYVINTRKRVRLSSENLEVSEKKAYVRSKSVEPIETEIECGVCFLKFDSLEALRIHEDYQTEVAEPFCNKCHTVCKSPHFLYDQKWVCKRKIKSSLSGKVLYCCRFCKAKYRKKLHLQCHVFHNHSKLLPCSAEKSVNRSQTDKPSKIKKINRTDNTSETDNGEEAAELQEQTRRKIVTRRSGATTEKVDLDLKTQKKVTRQSGTIVKSPNSNTVKDNRSFVEIHIDFNMMTNLSKNIKVEIENEPDYFALENYSARRMTRSSLERLSNDSNTTPVIQSPQRIRSRKHAFSTPKEKPKHQSTEEELRAKYKCKDCKINLVRCDMVVKEEAVDVTQISVEEGEDNAVIHRKEMKLRRVYPPAAKVNERIKVKVKESLQSSEVSNVPQDISKVNSLMSFRCKVCKKCFSLKKNLRKHFELRHVFSKSRIRDAKFKTKVELQRHYMNKRSDFKHMQCCVCFKMFSSLVMLKQHRILNCAQVLLPKRKKQRTKKVVKCMTSYKKSSCKACGKRFWLESCLKEHKKLCSKMRAREKQSQNVSNVEKISPTKRTLDDANTELDAPQPNSRLIDDHSCRVESPPMEQSKRLLKSVTYARGYNIDDSDMNKDKLFCSICKTRFQKFKNLCMHEQCYSKAATYVCSICDTAFSTATILNHHYRFTHTVDIVRNYEYYCTFCAQGFVKKVNVQIHTAHFHAGQTSFIPKPWLKIGEDWEVTKVCRVCNLVFESSEQFIQHNMFYYKGQLFTCTFCSKTFYGMYMLHNHVKFEHNAGDMRKQYKYTCDVCNEAFTLESHCYAHKSHVHSLLHDGTSQYLQDHNYVRAFGIAESMNEPIWKYNCDICYMRFITEEDMRQHKIEYTDKGEYLCSFCPRKYLTDAALSKHENLSHKRTNFTDCYKCRYCEEMLSTSTELTSHELHFHLKTSAPQYGNSNQTIANQTTDASGNATDAFHCSICGTKFESLEELNRHSVEYSNEGSYNCRLCNRHFLELCRLEVHKLNHSNFNFILSKYHCPVCREGFTNLTNIQMHLMHFHRSTAIVPSKASDVRNTRLLDEIVFKFKSILNSQPKNKFTCPKCLVTFDSARALISHKDRYTNEGSYVCEQCGRQFRFARLLKEHLRKHAISIDRLKLSCPLCDDRFCKSVTRYQHVVHLHWSNIWKDQVPDLTMIQNDPETAVYLLHNAEREASSPRVHTPVDQSIPPAKSEPLDAISSTNECSDSQESLATISHLADASTISTQEETQTENAGVKSLYENCPLCSVKCSSLSMFMTHLKNEHSQKAEEINPNPVQCLPEHVNHLIIGIVFADEEYLKTYLNESRTHNEKATVHPSKEGADEVEVVWETKANSAKPIGEQDDPEPPIIS